MVTNYNQHSTVCGVQYNLLLCFPIQDVSLLSPYVELTYFGVKYRHKREKGCSHSLKTRCIKSWSCLNPDDSENPSCLPLFDHKRRCQTQGNLVVIPWRMREEKQPLKGHLLGLCFVITAVGLQGTGNKWYSNERWWHHCLPDWPNRAPRVTLKLLRQLWGDLQ